MELIRKLFKSYWISSGFFSLGQRFLILFLGIGSFLILVRDLSKEELGAWAVFLFVSTVIEVTKNGFLKNGLIKFLNSKNEDESIAIKSSSFLLNIGLSLVFILLITFLAHPLASFLKAPALPQMLFLFTINIILLIFFSHFEFIFQAKFKFKYILFLYVLRQSTFFLLITTALIFWPEWLTLNYLVIAQAIGVFFAVLAGLGLSRGFFSYRFRFSKTWLLKLAQFGQYTFGTNLAALFFRNTDKLLIPNILSLPILALYDASIRITNLVDLPSTSLAEILFPKSVERSREGPEAVKRLFERSVGAILSFAIPTCAFIFIFPELILLIIAGPEYLEAAPVLRVVILYGLFLPFLKQFGAIMDSINKASINFRLTLGLAIFNIAINVLFIHELGFLGAALGTLITYALGVVACIAVLRRHLSIEVFKIFYYTLDTYKRLFAFVRHRNLELKANEK